MSPGCAKPGKVITFPQVIWIPPKWGPVGWAFHVDSILWQSLYIYIYAHKISKQAIDTSAVAADYDLVAHNFQRRRSEPWARARVSSRRMRTGASPRPYLAEDALACSSSAQNPVGHFEVGDSAYFNGVIPKSV